MCVVDLWRQKSVRQWTKLRVTVIQRMTLLLVSMNSRLTIVNIQYLNAWYNMIQLPTEPCQPCDSLCVCVRIF